ncbi:DMT family transporter [Ruegeria sp. Ofav3-42]|uniref:DMT family transporter n=1 Tax=Ruegeria sp. Ofav3-42 TaxID=2917759 RepID=UPI001EF50E57|nr:DMT family transporter [Ruegeria sp. Ofav3-42]MCG7518509.1 DMT family transporter [Ruegeria sp. Ofav3-42]
MEPQKHLSPRAWAELLLLGLIWGASFISIRIALDTIPVMTSVLHRVFWAMLALWIVVWVRKLEVPTSPHIWGAFLIMGLLNNAIPFSLMAWGQLYIETGLTSILNAATAVFGVLIAAMFFKDERLTLARGLGVGLGFLGVAIAIGLQNFATFDLQSAAQLAIIAGTVSYAFASAWARSKLSGLSPIVAAAGMLTGSTLLILPVTLVTDGLPTLNLPVITWTAIAYYALIATAGAYLLYYRVLAMAGAGNLMLVTLVIPPVAIVLGALLRDEALPPQAFFGFATLAVGLLILNRSRTRD